MSEYILQMVHYRHLVTRKVDGIEVYNEIKEHLNRGDVVVVNFNGIDTMTTYFAKQVFGKLYTELGVEHFSENVKFDKLHMTEDVELVLKIGIAGALSSLQIIRANETDLHLIDVVPFEVQSSESVP